jgi:hypothetical protein
MSLFTHQVSPSRLPLPTTATIGAARTPEDLNADHGHVPPPEAALMGTVEEEEDALEDRPDDIMKNPTLLVTSRFSI